MYDVATISQKPFLLYICMLKLELNRRCTNDTIDEIPECYLMTKASMADVRCKKTTAL